MTRAPFQLLSPYLHEAIAFTTAIERAGRLIMAARHGLATAHGLSVPAWRLLVVISRTRRRASAARIARLLRMSRQAVRQTAADLCGRGLISMPRGPANRKETQLLLTPKGHIAMAELDETMHFLLLEMTSEIPQETLTAAADLLNTFSAQLRRCETILGRR